VLAAPKVKKRYTGIKDGVAKGPRAGMREWINQAMYQCPALWDNGSYGVRSKKGKSSLSVHATGRAWDASYRYMPNHKDASNTKGVPKGRIQSLQFIRRVVANANELGVELIIDYYRNPKRFPYGRIWKCDRQAWRPCKPGEINGVPGDWWHIEIDPVKADSPIAVKAAYLKVFGEIRPKP
jgi:hypothetical protein